MKIKQFITLYKTKTWLRFLVGILGGALIGLLYWHFIGCNGGNCPLTNNPYKTVIIFSLIGGFFNKDTKEKGKQQV